MILYSNWQYYQLTVVKGYIIKLSRSKRLNVLGFNSKSIKRFSYGAETVNALDFTFEIITNREQTKVSVYFTCM